jgi:hypothetical protein
MQDYTQRQHKSVTSMQHVNAFRISPRISHVSSDTGIPRPCMFPSLRRVEPDLHDDGDFRSQKDGWGRRERLCSLYDLQRRLVKRR